MSGPDMAAQLEAERLRPVPPADGHRPGDPAWLPDLQRLIAALADLMLTEERK